MLFYWSTGILGECGCQQQAFVLYLELRECNKTQYENSKTMQLLKKIIKIEKIYRTFFFLSRHLSKNHSWIGFSC